MSINIPDIIWTAICFALFTLVMYFLLLKPVLRHMDARREKIRSAHALAEEREGASAARRKRLSEEADAARAAAEENNRRLIAEAENTAKDELAALREELEAREAAEQKELKKLAEETDKGLEKAMDGMIDSFAKKLTAGGRG